MDKLLWFGRYRSVSVGSVAAAIGPFWDSNVTQSLWVSIFVLVGRLHLMCKFEKYFRKKHEEANVVLAL